MDPESMTTDELIAASAELSDRTAGLFDRLAAVRASIVEDGITVTVNLDGRLVGLELSDEAVRLGPEGLGAEIFRLTQQAAGSALAEGITVLEPVAGPELMALLTPAPPGPSHMDDAEDFSAIESWAV